jgi:hypothetical protein
MPLFPLVDAKAWNFAADRSYQSLPAEGTGAESCSLDGYHGQSIYSISIVIVFSLAHSATKSMMLDFSSGVTVSFPVAVAHV